MSKKGRKVRAWHYRRIQEEFGRKAEIIIREMFECATPLTVMAGALGISYGEMHEWVRELGLIRLPIKRDNPYPTRERIREQFNHDPIFLICSDRAIGMTYREIRKKYAVSSGFIAQCLDEGAPWLRGTHIAPIRVGPPKISLEERKRMSGRCIEHNLDMKTRRCGWFMYNGKG